MSDAPLDDPQDSGNKGFEQIFVNNCANAMLQYLDTLRERCIRKGNPESYTRITGMDIELPESAAVSNQTAGSDHDKKRRNVPELEDEIPAKLDGSLDACLSIGNVTFDSLFLNNFVPPESPTLEKLLFDPRCTVQFRIRIPEKDAGLNAAEYYAVQLIGTNLNCSNDQRFGDYVRKSDRGDYELTERGRDILHDQLSSISTEILQERNHIKCNGNVPIYMALRFDSAFNDDGTQDSVAEGKPVFLDHTLEKRLAQSRRALGVLFDAPAVRYNPATGRQQLTEDEIRRLAEEAVGKAINDVVIRHMIELRHPSLKMYFSPGPARNQVLLTEEGAERLCDVIDDVAKGIAITALQYRAFLPNHLDGFRALLRYGVGINDKFFVNPVPDNCLFSSERSQVHFDIGTSDVGREEEIESLVVNCMANNMQSRPGSPLPDHPAFGSYFTRSDSGRYYLTECGEAALGERVRAAAGKINEQVCRLSEQERHGRVVMAYDFRNNNLEVFYVGKQISNAGSNPVHMALISAVNNYSGGAKDGRR